MTMHRVERCLRHVKGKHRRSLDVIVQAGEHLAEQRPGAGLHDAVIVVPANPGEAVAVRDPLAECRHHRCVRGEDALERGTVGLPRAAHLPQVHDVTEEDEGGLGWGLAAEPRKHTRKMTV